jgi:hypothetical protein
MTDSQTRCLYLVLYFTCRVKMHVKHFPYICNHIASPLLKGNNISSLKFLDIIILWGETKSLNCCHYRTHCSSLRWYELESDGGMTLAGVNRRIRRKTCPSANMSTANPTWIDPGANPGLRVERPATNRLSLGTALKFLVILNRECRAFVEYQ